MPEKTLAIRSWYARRRRRRAPAGIVVCVPYTVSTPVFEGPFDLLLHLDHPGAGRPVGGVALRHRRRVRGHPGADAGRAGPRGGHRVSPDRRRAAGAEGPPPAARAATTSSSRRSWPSGRSGTCCWPGCSSARRSRTRPGPCTGSWTTPAGRWPRVAGLDERYRGPRARPPGRRYGRRAARQPCRRCWRPSRRPGCCSTTWRRCASACRDAVDELLDELPRAGRMSFSAADRRSAGAAAR